MVLAARNVLGVALFLAGVALEAVGRRLSPMAVELTKDRGREERDQETRGLVDEMNGDGLGSVSLSPEALRMRAEGDERRDRPEPVVSKPLAGSAAARFARKQVG